MNVLDVLDGMIAENNLYAATSQMRNAVSTKSGQVTDPRGYVARLKVLARCIHIHVRDENVSKREVRQELIPLFRKAASRIIWEGEYFDYAKNTLQEKVVNLRRYCKGLDCIQTF